MMRDILLSVIAVAGFGPSQNYNTLFTIVYFVIEKVDKVF